MGVGIRNAFVESGMEVPPIADDGSSHGFSSWALANPGLPVLRHHDPVCAHR